MAPFQYFVSHGDPGLIEAVRKGRREEFTRFDWQGDVPDPQDDSTFLRSRISWDSRTTAPHKFLLAFYKELLRLRREDAVFSLRDEKDLEAVAREAPKSFLLRRWAGLQERVAIFNFEREPCSLRVPVPRAKWERQLASADTCWGGPGSGVPKDFVSAGELHLNLPASSFAVFKRLPEAP